MKVWNKEASKHGIDVRKLQRTVDASMVLQCLRMTLQKDGIEIIFKHFEIHIVCWNLLCRLHEAHGSRLSDWSDIYGDERNLPDLVLSLLMDTLEEERLETFIGTDSRPGTDHFLSKAGEILEDVVAHKGDVAGRNVRLHCGTQKCRLS